LETVCQRCLEKDPARRYQTAAALAEELGSFRRGEPVRARPVGALGRGWRWCRRNPRAALLLTALALLLLVGTASSLGVLLTAPAGAARARQVRMVSLAADTAVLFYELLEDFRNLRKDLGEAAGGPVPGAVAALRQARARGDRDAQARQEEALRAAFRA